MGKWTRPDRQGMTLLELIVTATILAILAGLAIPLAQVVVQRQKEAELRRALRILRTAIDEFHRAVAPPGLPPGSSVTVDPPVMDPDTKYPRDLEVLTEWVTVKTTVPGQDPREQKYRFLRRIPEDPMTGSLDWGKLCIDQKPPQTGETPPGWCGRHVYDVYTRACRQALDRKSRYCEW
ncbi:MAG: type II secretion system GspH family protein [Acidobacteria bacterium]|nr:type II secretion system GspH family protein [Acidobacteriota bacterium]MDW7983992.1 type II secretion system protein [Acidobacteriota bacterium]